MSSILLIQSDPAASQRLCDAFGSDARFAVCGAVTTLAEARRFISGRTPDLLIADLRLHDAPFSALLRELRPGRSHTLVLTASLHDPLLMHALRMGADGYLLAGCPADTTREVVRQTLAGASAIAPEIARLVLAHFDALNARPLPAAPAADSVRTLAMPDRQLLEWFCAGYMPHEVARILDLTPRQIGLRVRSLYRSIQFEPSVRATAPRVS